MNQPSTTVQWTMRLSDAVLIGSTLRDAAESEERSAAYLAGDAYAETQRKQRLAKPKDEQGPPWSLSDHDKQRIAEALAKAARLRELAES